MVKLQPSKLLLSVRFRYPAHKKINCINTSWRTNMYYTIYKITNKLNGKFYIGSHKTHNLEDGYMGSGKYLKYAQEKYGIENFTKEILFIFDTQEQMFQKEAEIVNEDFLATENTYNLKRGGFGGWDFINADEELRIEKNRKAIARTQEVVMQKYGVDNYAKTLAFRERQSAAMREEIKNGINRLVRGTFKGQKHSHETKTIIGQKNRKHQTGEGNSQYGTMWITNGITSKKLNKTDSIPLGWKRGRCMNK